MDTARVDIADFELGPAGAMATALHRLQARTSRAVLRSSPSMAWLPARPLRAPRLAGVPLGAGLATLSQAMRVGTVRCREPARAASECPTGLPAKARAPSGRSGMSHHAAPHALTPARLPRRARAGWRRLRSARRAAGGRDQRRGDAARQRRPPRLLRGYRAQARDDRGSVHRRCLVHPPAGARAQPTRRAAGGGRAANPSRPRPRRTISAPRCSRTRATSSSTGGAYGRT